MPVSRGPRRSTSVNAVALPKVRAARPSPATARPRSAMPSPPITSEEILHQG